MSWGQNKLFLGKAATAALLVTAAASAAANVLVVRSAGPSAKSYPAGRSLGDNARIALRGGDTLVVLDARGTRTFRGPGNFTAGASPRGARTADASTGRRARIGAVRSAGILPNSPTTIWDIDVSQSGNVCLPGPENVMLWRPDASQATTLSIRGPDGASGEVRWPAGSATAAWPAALRIANGGTYQLRASGTAVPARITVRALGSQPTDIQGVAQALIANECREQLDLLVDTAPTL